MSYAKLKEIQADLPSNDGEEWIWVSVFRDKIRLSTNIRNQNCIRADMTPNATKNSSSKIFNVILKIVADQMNFKLIHIFSDGKVETISISPDEYSD